MSSWLRESIGEIFGGCTLVVLGVVWVIGAEGYGLIGDGGRLAPGSLPFLCGAGLIVTGVIIGLKAVVVSRGNFVSRDSDRDLDPDDADEHAIGPVVVSALRSQVEGVQAATAETAVPRVEMTQGATTQQSVVQSDQPVVTGRGTLLTRIRRLPVTSPVLTVYGLMVFGVLFMPVLGFALAFAILIFAILRLVERQPVHVSAMVGIVTAVLGYLLFEVLFNLPLPDPFFL